MSGRFRVCECRWCASDLAGLVIFVTLPSNEYADMIAIPDHEKVAGAIPGERDVKRVEYENQVHEGRISDLPNFGRLLIPPGGFFRDVEAIVARRGPWACDNGSFNVFDEKQFYKMLEHVADYPYCHFVACPDLVWNKFPDPNDYHLSAIGTIELFTKWAPIIKDYGLPAGMVGQDGLEQYDIPWDLMDAYFVGGSDRWKTSAASEHIIREAKDRGMWVHVGRVSGGMRMNWAMAAGADSIDGSALGRFRGAEDKRDGLGRLHGALVSAMQPVQDRIFVTDLKGNHE